MKSFLTYFKYHARATLIRLPILTLISILLTNMIVGDSLRPADSISYPYSYASVDFFAFLSICLCLLIPFLELSGFKNRRNLDTLFALPASRVKMAAAHWLNGWIQLWVIYSAAFVTAVIRWIPYRDLFHLEFLPHLYFAVLGLTTVFYSAAMFVFQQANTVADGAVFLGLSLVLFYLPVGAIIELFDLQGMWEQASELIGFYPLFTLINRFDYLVSNRYASWRMIAPLDAEFYRALALWCAVAVIALVAYLYTFAKKPTEKAGSISDSWFGYRTLIPICGFSLYLMLGVQDEVWSVLFFCGMLAAYVIYRRTFRLKRSDLIILGISLLCSAVGMVL